MVLPKLKRHLNEKKTLSDPCSIRDQRNLNETVNSGDCRSDFHHHSSKTYDSGCTGRVQLYDYEIHHALPSLEYGTQFREYSFPALCSTGCWLRGKRWLDIAASSGGHKNPRPRSESFSSLLLLGLSSRMSCRSSTSAQCGESLESRSSSSCLQSCYSTFLWVYPAACYQVPFFIYPVACHQRQPFVTRRLPAPILILIKYLLPPLSRLLCAWAWDCGLPSTYFSVNG